MLSDPLAVRLMIFIYYHNIVDYLLQLLMSLQLLSYCLIHLWLL